MSKLSIIMPVYREGPTLRNHLLRLQPFRQQGHEVLLVSGAGDDHWPERCRELVDQLLLSPRGRALQMNRGAADATGDVLLFLHADTVLPGNAPQLVLEGLASGSYCWGRFDVRLSGSHAAFRVIAFMMNQRSRLTGICTGDQAIFVHRSTFDVIGAYPGQALMEDIALTSRLRRISRPLCVQTPVITSSRRWEKQGIWRTVIFMWYLRLAYFLGADPQKLHNRYHTTSADRGRH